MMTKSERTWVVPDPRSYADAILASPMSLLPGLSGVESFAAMSYLSTLPMSRNRSVMDTWLALSSDVRAEWVGRTRAALEVAA